MKESCVFRKWDREEAWWRDLIGCQDKERGEEHHAGIRRVKKKFTAGMNLINEFSWSAYFEQRGNHQRRRSLGKWLLEEGRGCARGCIGVRS